MPHKCLSIIILGSVIYAYEKYHPQTFLEECKYAKEKIKTNNYIDEELKSESDSDKRNFLTQKSLIVYVNHVLLGFYFC